MPAAEKVRGRHLRLQVTDLLFETRLHENRAQLFLAPEHKSSHEAGLFVQLLDYAVHVRHSGRQSRLDPPPLVLVAVLYHGDPPFRSGELDHPLLQGIEPVAAADLAGSQPTLRFLVDDLSTATEASIRSRFRFTGRWRATKASLPRSHRAFRRPGPSGRIRFT